LQCVLPYRQSKDALEVQPVLPVHPLIVYTVKHTATWRIKLVNVYITIRPYDRCRVSNIGALACVFSSLVRLSLILHKHSEVCMNYGLSNTSNNDKSIWETRGKIFSTYYLYAKTWDVSTSIDPLHMTSHRRWRCIWRTN
jgi:hypothetical protein